MGLGVLSFSWYLIQSFSTLRNRFVEVGDRGEILGISINTNGRTRVWDFLIRGIENHLLLGQGIGESNISVSFQFVSIVQPHNDYLRLAYDLGLVGLMLWLFAVVRIGVILKGEKILNRSASALPVILLLSFALSDNPIIYPFFLLCFARVIAIRESVPTMPKSKLLS
jgi:O-antigen ligase